MSTTRTTSSARSTSSTSSTSRRTTAPRRTGGAVGLAATVALAVGMLAAPATAGAAADPNAEWSFRGTGSTGTVTAFTTPLPPTTLPSQPLMCDLDELGDQAVLAGGSLFQVATAEGTAVVRFGRAGDVPLCGDWDGGGEDTPGVRRGNVYHLASSWTDGGGTVRSHRFGQATDSLALTGDWDGNGTDTVAVRRGNVFHASRANTDGGGAVVRSGFGRASDDALAGDFAGAGHDSLALRRAEQVDGRTELVFHVASARLGTVLRADRRVPFGQVGDVPVAGRPLDTDRDQVGAVRFP